MEFSTLMILILEIVNSITMLILLALGLALKPPLVVVVPDRLGVALITGEQGRQLAASVVRGLCLDAIKVRRCSRPILRIQSRKCHSDPLQQELQQQLQDTAWRYLITTILVSLHEASQLIQSRLLRIHEDFLRNDLDSAVHGA